MNWVFAALAALAGYYMMSDRTPHSDALAQAQQGDLALNMGIYRAAVTRFARDNPGFSGTAGDERLVFPSWYVRNPTWTNRIADGAVAVYPAQPLSVNIAADIVRLSGNSMLAGVARGAVLYSPIYGDTGIPLSPSIPQEAPVWLAELR